MISIIIPIYNVEQYLNECIDSILEQSYKNLEIILVNDGSTDNSGKICDEYKLKDDRIVVFHKENGGLSDARNYGIERAKGEYIYLIDSDDFLIRNDTIELLYINIIKYDSDIAIANYIEYHEGDEINYSSSNGVIVIDKEEAIYNQYNYMDYKYSFLVAWNKLYKRILFNNIKYPYRKLHEDEFTTYKIYLEAERIVYLDLETYAYRQRKGSIMKSGYSIRRLDAIEALEERIQLLRNNNISIKETIYNYIILISLNMYMTKRYGYIENNMILKNKFNSIYNDIYSDLSNKRKVKLFILKYFGNYYYKYIKKLK